jgi:hypothetical protein
LTFQIVRVSLESFVIKGKPVSIFEKKIDSDIEGVDKIVIDESMVPRYEDLTEQQRREMFNSGVMERELLFRSFENRLRERNLTISTNEDLSSLED